MQTFYKTVFDSISLPAAVWDAKGKLIEMNSAFSKFFVISPPIPEGERQLWDYTKSDCKERVADLFLGLITRNRHEPVSIQVPCVDEIGNNKPVKIYFKKLEESEQILTIWVDGAVDSNGRNDKGNAQDLEALFYLISHNLKSPLVAIQGFADVLLEKGVSLPDKDRQHYLNRIKKNASHLSEMVRDILEFSKATNSSDSFEAVSLKDILSNIHAEFYFRLKKKGIDFQVPGDLPDITANVDGITTVFVNLIDNAIKYIGNVAGPKIEIGWEDKGRFYFFWVRDNGMGIPEKFHEKAFDLFERAGAPKDIEGTGVGLSIVKRIIENHGGLVRLMSEPNKGASVYFTLPKLKK